MEILDIGISDLNETLNIKFDDDDNNMYSSGSGNSGRLGMEMLMNDKHRSGNNSSIADIGDLDKLESELNEIKGDNNPPNTGSKILSGFSNMFNFDTNSNSNTTKEVNTSSGSNVGTATSDIISGKSSTWDGYRRADEIPVTSNIPTNYSDRERRRKKRIMIGKLDDWYSKGLIKNSSQFNIDSNYEDVEDEYESALEAKRKKESVKLQGHWFTAAVNSLEYANAYFNPFDINLDGWGEKVSEDVDDYEEIFGELYEKYKGGKLSPEISLLFRLGVSAAVVNITNKAFSNTVPEVGNVMKQNPELMKMFSNAMAQSMSQQNPAFSFAAGMANKEPQVNNMFGAPPPPMETNPSSQSRSNAPSMTYTQHPGNRPDLTAGRGEMFRESGVDLNNNNDYNKASRIPMARPEMKGPQTDISNILSGLKPKERDVVFTNGNTETDSMISVMSLNDINNTNLPKRARRKQRSDKNIISLDI
jgi:hypothetical protein